MRRSGRNAFDQRLERLLAIGVAAPEVAEVADDRPADIAFPAHRHMRRDPVRGDIAQSHHGRGDDPADDQRRDQPDPVDPAAVALFLAEQSLQLSGRIERQQQAASQADPCARAEACRAPDRIAAAARPRPRQTSRCSG